jgi:hypothetical protein
MPTTLPQCVTGKVQPNLVAAAANSPCPSNTKKPMSVLAMWLRTTKLNPRAASAVARVRCRHARTMPSAAITPNGTTVKRECATYDTAIPCHLTMRLSDAELRRQQTKLIYPDHRPSPRSIEDAAPRSLEPIVRRRAERRDGSKQVTLRRRIAGPDTNSPRPTRR